MGKRKIHGEAFYQCDYTGFPMRQAYCYMPTWDAAGKLVKKGSYCNWESVLAHAAMTHYEEYDRVKAHIVSITGTDRIRVAPDYTELYHMKGHMTPHGYHMKCTMSDDPIIGVKITMSGEVIEVVITPSEDGFRFEDFMHKPYTYHGKAQIFHSMRKKAGTTAKDLTVLYYPSRDLPTNTVASNVFKMQIHGDVLMVQQSREQSFMPRERYVTYTRQEFLDQFMKKRKRGSTETPAMSTEDYNNAKRQMQEKLKEFEAEMSKDAKKPSELTNQVKTKTNNSFRTMAADLAAAAAAGDRTSCRAMAVSLAAAAKEVGLSDTAQVAA
jgi:hypothetical protein